MVRIVFRKIHSSNFYLKLLEINLKNKKNIIELIESMKELIHQKKSNWTIKKKKNVVV